MKPSDLKKLLSQMSLEEKIGELFQLPSYLVSGGNVTGPAAELGLTGEDLCRAGSCLSVTGAGKLRELQDKHMAEHPHHIPMLFMADIINGYKTVFPIPLAQGCTFNPGQVEECAAAAARETAAAGVHVTFSPMADLVRDPRWGRVMESTGEDAYLNGKMAAAMIAGYQGKENDLTKKGRIASCLKHFAAYGAPDGGRDYNTVELSERTLRDDYLPAYKDAIDAGCELVMTSFNTLNRIPSSANRYLMQDILRTEMGFDGVLISDWQAIAELIPHGIAADAKEAAHLAMLAGVDIDMATSVYVKHLKELIENHDITQTQLDTAVLRVLQLKNKLGLFENPYKDGNEEDEKTLLLCDAHREAARKCAEDSFVLLKNDDQLLPLHKSCETISFIGPYVDNKLTSGAWSFFADDDTNVTLKAGIVSRYPDTPAFFAQGCPTVDPGVKVFGFQKNPAAEEIDSPQALTLAMEEAVALAKRTDKVVLALGEHREYSGEGASKADITLPDCQLELLDRIYAVNQNICVVLFNGRPLDIRPLTGKAKAILEVWLPGTEGGNAIARTLFGDSIPSGKLSMSFPYCVGQIPVHYSHMNTGRPFHGNYLTERYASKYIDIPNEPLYPFGYGLSYTAFSCSPVTLSSHQLTRDKAEASANTSIKASVTLANTGNHTGTETLQLYLQDISGSVTRPVRELKGFCKVTLKPGEEKTVTFTITEEMLRFHDISMQYRSEPGAFYLYIGSDSTTDNKAEFVLK